MTLALGAPPRLPCTRSGPTFSWWYLAVAGVAWGGGHAVMTVAGARLWQAEPGAGELIAPMLAVTVWAVFIAAATLAVSVVGGARWARVAPWALAVAAAYLHRDPSDLRAPGIVGAVAPLPIGGWTYPEAFGMPSSSALLVAWRVGWAVLDLAVVLALAHLLTRRAGRQVVRLKAIGASRVHLLGAGVGLALVVAVAGATTAVPTDQAISVFAAGTYLHSHGLVLVVAALCGLAARAHRGPVLALAVALVGEQILNALIVGDREWMSPQRLAVT